ncbi:MAG: hypothetical protein J6Y94_05525, partial [Bacteriovoracaceae bacterium]|nr:hypothetical protein [Bacteriovoracaceae bacterium]
EVHLKLPNASKDVSPNHKHHNSSAESFSYKIPYNVLRAVYDTHAGDASPADRLKEFRVYNELYLKNSAVKRSDFDPASYQRVCQKIYNHDAFVDLLYFLQRQYAYWSKIGKLFQEVDFQWQAIEGHSARFTLANINSMQEDLQKLLTVLQEDDLHYPWLEKEGTMMKNCAGWLVPGGGR